MGTERLVEPPRPPPPPKPRPVRQRCLNCGTIVALHQRFCDHKCYWMWWNLRKGKKVTVSNEPTPVLDADPWKPLLIAELQQQWRMVTQSTHCT